MASSRQLKHHTEFRSAVFRNLFAASSTPPAPKQISLTPQTLRSPEIQIDDSAGVDHESSFVLAPLPIPSHDEEIYLGKVREMLKSKKNVTDSCFDREGPEKRQRLKNIKESIDKTHETKRFLGPFLPVSLKRQMSSGCIPGSHDYIDLQTYPSGISDLRQHERDVCNNVDHIDDTHFAQENPTIKDDCDNISACHGNLKPQVQFTDISGPQAQGDVSDHFKQKGRKDLSYAAFQEENGTTTNTCDASGSMSKNKRRRLAKKHFLSSDNRRPSKSSVFCAEIQGKSIFVKKMT